MKVTTWLRCAACGRETVHEMTYHGDCFVDARCVGCGTHTRTGSHSVGPYVRSVPRRVRSKPERVARELRRHPQTALTLPRRIVSKPSRLRQEVLGITR